MGILLQDFTCMIVNPDRIIFYADPGSIRFGGLFHFSKLTLHNFQLAAINVRSTNPNYCQNYSQNNLRQVNELGFIHLSEDPHARGVI